MKNQIKTGRTYKENRIFEESDGWHVCSSRLDYLDARGRGYASISSAKRAINDDIEQRKIFSARGDSHARQNLNQKTQ
jgi:hypothetical protein